MTSSVHPAYDPIDKLWFTEDGVTAKSLAALQRELPGATIEGYYPNGYGLITEFRPPKTRAAPTRLFRWGRKPIPPTPVSDDESETELEAAEATEKKAEPQEAALKQPVTYPGRYRSHRNPSAFPKVNWKLVSNQLRLRELVEAGLTSVQIGLKMDCSRNAIIGACARLGYQLKYEKGGKPKGML